MQIYIKNLKDHLDREVTLKGWVYNFRSSGKIAFLQLRDGSGYTQCIVSQNNVDNSTWETAGEMTYESSVEITGTVSKHPKKDEYELQVKSLKFIQRAPDDWPIGKKEHGPDFLLSHRHLWLRSPRQAAIQKVRTTIIKATYDFLLTDGFTKIDSPIFTPNACEGTTDLFKVDYFDDTVYLSQSGQLYLEAAIASLGKVFDFGPTFRAEKSKTRRHLTEFWMMDAEMAFYDHEMNMQMQEKLFEHIAAEVVKRNAPELKTLERDIEALKKIKAPFHRFTYNETIKRLQELGSDIKPGEDLGNDDETLLMKDLDKPAFVELWPAEIKAFYMKRNPDGLALCSDLIAPEGHGEIVGGSQREDDYDTLLKRIRKHKLPEKEFAWYLDTRKYGSVPHSGFGYGLERVTGWMCGTSHIRETIPFPRMINRIYP